MNSFIPVNEPLIGSEERELVLQCLDTGWISSEGPFVKEFEEKFSERVGRKFGIACANGSAALDIAVSALRIQPGDEVIIPSFTIISCALSVVRAGAVPVFVDADPETWNLDVSQVEAAITSRTVAIMAVHIYGLPVDMDPLVDIANRHGLAVIEDAAELIGGLYKGRPIGSFGHISTFSFYPNKHITTGEGGMVVTDDPDLAERCSSLRNLCFKRDRRFVHDELGWNYRMTNIQAAIGLGQLKRIDQSLARKRQIGLKYRQLLAGINGLKLPPSVTPYADNLFWVFALELEDKSMDAASFCKRLAQLGIGTRPFFYPLHLQPALAGLFRMPFDAPVAERIASQGFYIPSGLALRNQQIEIVADTLKQLISRTSNGYIL